MNNALNKLILGMLVLSATFGSQADVLLIERVESKGDLNLPSKSHTMDQVRSQFGDPLSESNPVGEPPITQWTYDNFVVYFEYSHVITSVVKKSKPTEIGPKTAEQETSQDKQEVESTDDQDN